jgi:hypothetical protein
VASPTLRFLAQQVLHTHLQNLCYNKGQWNN